MSAAVAALRHGAQKLPRPLKDLLRLMMRPRESWVYLQDYHRFARQVDWIVKALDETTPPARGEVLIHAMHGFVPSAKEEFVLAAMLRQAGLTPVFLMRRGAFIERYLRLLPGARVVFWEDFGGPPSAEDSAAADRLLQAAPSAADLVDLEQEGVAIGRHALSWFMRIHRVGQVDIESHRPELGRFIAESLTAIRTARAILAREPARFVLMNERGYTPFGEFFDLALAEDRRVIQYVASHRDDARIYKRYTTATRTEHPYGLSNRSWETALSEPFGLDQEHALLMFWRDRYASQRWFNFQRLQHRTRMMQPQEVVQQLGLDPRRKIAAVFAHIFWDATFFYGESLYQDYQQWFVETVRIANQNPAVNWVIKLHPVNAWRLEADGIAGARYSEITALEEAGIRLAPHVQLVLPDTPISTWSLFEASDYCVTVRGTVGVEMAALGKQVITAGSGPYSARGFTLNPQSIADHARILATIQDLPRPESTARERALRYGHWLLKRKPFRFGTFEMQYSAEKGIIHALNGHPVFHTNEPKTLLSGIDARCWTEWFVEGENYDCIGSGVDE